LLIHYQTCEQYFESQWTDFDANCHKRSTGQRLKQSTSGVRRSKAKVTQCRSRSQKSIRRDFARTMSQIFTIVAGTYYGKCRM